MAQTSGVHTQDILALQPPSPPSQERSPDEFLSKHLAEHRMKSPEDLKWVKLCGSGTGPTSISYLCWWPGVEGKLSIEYCIQLSGSLGSCVLCGYSFPRLAMRSVSSPSVLFLALLRSGPSCGSHLHTCHEKAAVVRHNIISAAEREGKACVAVPSSVYSP